MTKYKERRKILYSISKGPFFVFIGITLVLLFSGCSIVSHGRLAKITHDQVDSIEVGVSTKEDIVKLLGKPQQIVYKPDNIEIYSYRHGVERSIGIPFIVSWGRAGGTGQTLTVSFQFDKVVDYEFVTDDRGMIE